MFLRILKKDLKRKKGINLILFIVIAVATIFLASSWNNMLVVSGGTDYFLDKAKIPAEYITLRHQTEGPAQLEEWLEKNSDIVKSYSVQQSVILQSSNVKLIQGGKTSEYETRNSIYLESVPEDYALVFDEDGNDISLNEGEVAVSVSEAGDKNISTGDKLQFTCGDVTKTLTVKVLVKEALFAGDMCGMIRFVLSEEDYEYLKAGTGVVLADHYFIDTDDTEAFDKAYGGESFAGTPAAISRDTIELIYVMDLIVAGMLTAIGICLIAMAVLVLRFTIVFTIEEEYREIGIMKAIGIRDMGIKSIYLVKYLALVIAGSIVGCIISFPVGNAMLKSVSKKMLLADSGHNWIFNVICAVLVVALVLSLCYLSMRKLNKLSVMDAIRSGQTGERFHKKSKMMLHKRKGMAVPFYLAVNDIVSNTKRYIALLLVFAVGIVLIIVPFNTINTMKSAEMAQEFALDSKADAYIDRIGKEEKSVYETTSQLKEGLKNEEEKFRAKGYDVTLNSGSLFFGAFQAEKESATLLMMQPVNSEGLHLTYMEGEAPILENEVAVSKKALRELGLNIGDSVDISINGVKNVFIITGTYQDYMQLGKSARMNPAIDLEDTPIFDYWVVQAYFEEDVDIEELKKQFPEYTFQTAQEIVNGNVGGVIDVIDNMRVWLITLMAGINMMITVLMMKMFMMNEKGQIAMLRSVGFRNVTIRAWQAIRIAGILAMSAVVAIPLSKLMDYLVLRPIFGIMGAEIKIEVIPLEVYVLYPGIMAVVILIAAIVNSASIKKIDIRELSNLE